MYSRASVNSNWGYVLKMVSVTQKQDHLRMNVAPDQTGLQIFLDHRSLSSIGHKILMPVTPPPPPPPPPPSQSPLFQS